jgi:hypothetical protein
MLAHIAGVPVEESIAYIAMSCTGTVVAIRVWFGRWLPLWLRSRVARTPKGGKW